MVPGDSLAVQEAAGGSMVVTAYDWMRSNVEFWFVGRIQLTVLPDFYPEIGVFSNDASEQVDAAGAKPRCPFLALLSFENLAPASLPSLKMALAGAKIANKSKAP